jgi:hypothetical protein
MPIKRRKELPPAPKRTNFVYTDDDGLIVVKTPPACSRWPQPFRMRIVRDYVPPKTIKTYTDYEAKFVENGYQDEVYVVQGIKLKVRQPIEALDNSTHVVILRTEIVNIREDKSMFLYHDDPAIRSLMVYSFITGERLGGIPQLQIYETRPT